MRKRTSKRRWKKRAALGRPISAKTIVEHQLNKWFRFEPWGNPNRDLWADPGGLYKLVIDPPYELPWLAK